MTLSTERGALPIVTVEPQYPSTGAGDGSVILYDLVGQQGQLTSVRILRDAEPLTSAAVTAVQQWSFAPGRRAGEAADSAAIVVVAFRHSGGTQPFPQKK